MTAFAQAVSDLLDDPDRRARMGAAGRRRVEQVLAWPHQVGAYVGVYERLLGARAGGDGSVGDAPPALPQRQP